MLSLPHGSKALVDLTMYFRLFPSPDLYDHVDACCKHTALNVLSATLFTLSQCRRQSLLTVAYFRPTLTSDLTSVTQCFTRSKWRLSTRRLLECSSEPPGLRFTANEVKFHCFHLHLSNLLTQSPNFPTSVTIK